ncbi:hypothetical protein WMY93_008190 [Mugilogobius chulae]|uniref:Uncharacterized protein n=1 Tax=Mugilogobius chulae TaxID=88201 RepID=A0AAW0PR28_9GOBI
MEKQTLEENILQLHNKIANFQNNFVEASQRTTGSGFANEARTKSRVSELETENNKLQVHLLDKETKEKQLQDQLNTRIKELEAELLAEKKISEEHEKLRAELNQYVLKHSKDRADIEALREKAQQDKDLLSGQLRKANQKSELLKTQLNKTKHEAQQERRL